jgi:hypothetical protein
LDKGVKMTIRDRVFLRHKIMLKAVKDRREELERGTILLHPFCAVCSRGIKDDFMLVHKDDRKSHLGCLLTEEECEAVLSQTIKLGNEQRSMRDKQKIKSDLLRQQ